MFHKQIMEVPYEDDGALVFGTIYQFVYEPDKRTLHLRTSEQREWTTIPLKPYSKRIPDVSYAVKSFETWVRSPRLREDDASLPVGCRGPFASVFIASRMQAGCLRTQVQAGRLRSKNLHNSISGWNSCV